MAGKKISELDNAEMLKDNDLFLIANKDENKNYKLPGEVINKKFNTKVDKTDMVDYYTKEESDQNFAQSSHNHIADEISFKDGETFQQKLDNGELKGQDGVIGHDGVAGKSLEFNWDGTKLGVRQEGETEYTYVDLKGNSGDATLKGDTGKSIEFNWNGTQLGIRQEGETSYQYVDLKGEKGASGANAYEIAKNNGFSGTEIEWLSSLKGDTGAQGIQGEKGEKGIQGEKGEKGDTGAQGIQGEKGEKGDTGDQGIQGIQGEKGNTGAVGKDGESLEFNWNGTQLGIKTTTDTKYTYVDLKGEKGNTGAAGKDGTDGINGKSLEFNWNGTQLGIRQEGETNYQYVDLKGVQGGNQGVQGDTGAAGKSLEFNWNGTSLGVRQEGETEYTYVDLKGEKGDTGAQGIQGEKGEKGDTGVQGIQGEKGDTGSAGVSSYLHIKYASSNNPTSNEMNNINGKYIGLYIDTEKEDSLDPKKYNWLNFKGDQGIQGEKGNTGTAGKNGIDGINGKSLEFNWNGTSLGVRQEGETTYQYQNLKGEKGDTGAQGIQGEKGDTGNQGIQGNTGAAGKSLEFNWNGTQLGIRQEGDTSYQYVDLKGEKGIQGEKGDTGSAGKDGINNKDIITELTISDSTCTLLATYKYQKVDMVNNTTIVLPSVTDFIEIHLFFSVTEALTLIFPNDINWLWQEEPYINENKTYEFVFTYIGKWLGNFAEYGA